MLAFILITLVLMLLVFGLLLTAAGQKKHQKILDGVSEAGYETAIDVLFPGMARKFKSPLKYGPVLPSRR